MTFKRGELFGRLEDIKDLLELKGGSKFIYAVVKNIDKLEREYNLMMKANKAVDGMDKFNIERIELVKKHSLLNENGKPKTVRDQQGRTHYEPDPAQSKELDVGFTKLKKKFNKEITAEEARTKEYNEVFLEEEIGIEFHMLEMESWPETLSVKQGRSLVSMTNEPADEPKKGKK